MKYSLVHMEYGNLLATVCQFAANKYVFFSHSRAFFWFCFCLYSKLLTTSIDHTSFTQTSSILRTLHSSAIRPSIIHFTKLIWFLNFMRLLLWCRSVFLVNFSLHKLWPALRCADDIAVDILHFINDTIQRTNDMKKTTPTTTTTE